MNNYHNIYKNTENILKNFYPVYHAPLIFDIGTQSSYRKAGYVAWPKKTASDILKSMKDEEKRKNRSDNGVYFAHPKK